MSLVFHTASPLVPTFRSDVRYLEVDGEGWFDGGADLTPYYLNDEDVAYFHRFYRDICERYDTQVLYDKLTLAASFQFLFVAAAVDGTTTIGSISSI